MNDDIRPRAPVLLFLKAVTKKQVWIPGYTKRDGTVVAGHMHWVNVSTDHDEHKAVTGQGNYTEKEAHKKLSKKDWFNAMPHDHKVAHVLKEATAIQQKASMLSRANSLKKKILAGEKPINAEWKAFNSLPGEKKEEFGEAFKQAGKWHEFAEGFQQWKASAPNDEPEAAQEAAKESPKVVAAKEEAKPAAPAPEPAAKLPEGWTGSPHGLATNKDQVAGGIIDKNSDGWFVIPHSDDIEAMHGLPSQKAAIDALADAVAKVKEKAAAKPAAEPKPKAAEPVKLSDLAEKQGASNVAKAAVLDKIEAAKAKLPADHHITPGQKKKLDAIAHALVTDNPKDILAHGYPTHTYGKQAAKLANEALAALGSKHTVAPGQKMGEHAALKDEDAPAAEHKPEPAAAPAPKPEAKPTPSWLNPAKPSDATTAHLAAESKKLAASKAAAADEGPKEGDTKEGADGTLVLKDGHWVKQGEQAAAAPAGGLAMPEFAPNKDGETKYAEHYAKVAKKIKEHAEAGNVQVLEDMKADGLTPKNGKVGNTWKGKTANSKTLMAFYDAALKHAKGEAPAAAAEPAMESAPADIPSPEAELPKAVSDALLAHPDGMGQKTWEHVATLATGGHVDELKEYGKTQNADTKMWIADVVVAMGAKPEPTAPGVDVVDASLKVDADKALAEGDLQTLKDIAAYAKKEGMTATEFYASKHIGELESKKAATEAPTAPGAKPVKPELSSLTSQGIADKIEKLMAAGDMQGLMDQQTMIGSGQPAATNFGKLEQYAKDAIAHVAANATTPAATVPTPSIAGYTVATKDVKEAYEKGDKSLLQAWANEKPLTPGLGEVIKYAQDCLNALNGVAPTDSGPKEGDTKMGADGMLVFKDGRWHKQGGEEPAAAAPTGPDAAKIIAGLKVPKMTGKNSVKLKNHIKSLHMAAATGGAEALGKILSITPEGKVKVHGLIPLSTTVQTHGANALEFAQYAKQLHDAVIGAGAVGGGAAAAPAPAPKKAASKVVGTTATETESVDGWKQVGPQGGYNPGGTYEDASGQKWYVKFPAGGEKVAKNELVATKLYALAGVEVPEVKLINQGGKIGLASKIIDGAVANKSALLEGKAKGLLSGFAADAWLANWDTVGNNPAAGKGFDNILFKPDGSAVRIDAGGALLYGGAGGKKQTFENEVTDLKTMLDPAKNANTAAVFGKMSAADITASVAKIADIPDHEIEGVVMEFGPGSASEKTRLAEKLIARKHNMSEQFPTAKAKKEGAGKAAKKKLDPTALPVDASLLPAPHDFMNWQGTGKPISDKAYVHSNISDEQEIINLALTGNLPALKAYKFQPVDKLTGAPLGAKKSIDEHPSKYVQDFHNNVVSYLDMLANPPEELRPMTAKKASTLAALSAAFKPADFGMTTAKAPKNQQIGFWIALGVAESPEKFAPPAKELAASAIDSAKAKHPKLPTSVRQFISGVQGSGSYNNPYRDGLEKDHGGNNTREVLTDLYNNATAHEAGTTISKWISFAPEMVKQFMDAPDGLVFQNPGSMCTSYDPTATKHFGKDRITIRYADGAKALDSFASGSFKSEMEVTTLPGARFMVLSRKMVADTEHGKSSDKRFELELLMLPPDPTYVDNLLKKA